MRRIAIALLVLSIFPAIAVAKTAKPKKAKPDVVFKIGTLVPTGSTFEKILREMTIEWERTSGGKLGVTVYADGSRGSESKMVREIRGGVLDGGMFTVIGLSDVDKSVQALQSMPMMFRSYEEVDEVGRHLQPVLEAKLREKGFVVLFWADAGWVHFFSSQQILRPADLKKAKIFTWAGDPVAVEIYKSAGYQPIVLETDAIHSSLLSGMIDTVLLPPVGANAFQIAPKAVKHMLDLKYAPLVGALVIHEKSWNKLDPAMQKSLAEVAARAGKRMQKENHAAADAAVAAMVKRGLTVHHVTPELESEWIKELEKSYAKIRGGIVPAPLFDDVKKILADYRRKNAPAK